MDSDNDGVCDGLELRPNTPPQGRARQGRLPERETETLDKGVITVRDIDLTPAKWALKSGVEQDAEMSCARSSSKGCTLQIEMGGHADARGATSTTRT